MAVISRTGVIPLADYPSGLRSFGPIALPDNIASARFEIARATGLNPDVWANPNFAVQLDTEISFDGGATWAYAGGCGSFGGRHTRLGGFDNADTVIKIPFQQALGRLWRGTLTFIGGLVRTSGLIELHNPTFNNANSVQGLVVANLTTPAWLISGSDRLLVAGMGWADGAPPAYSEMRWGGAGGTLLTQVGATLSFNFSRLAMARLIAPTAASQTLYGAVAATTNELAVGGVSVTDAHQTTPLGTSVTASALAAATPATATVNVGSAADELVIDVALGNNAGAEDGMTVAVGALQTMRWEQEGIGAFTAVTQSTEPGVGTTTMSEVFTSGGSAIDWGIIAVAIKAAAVAGRLQLGRNIYVMP